MRVADLGSRRVAVWGLGREGRAAIGFLRRYHPSLPLLVLDDAADAKLPESFARGIKCAFGAHAIGNALAHLDVIIKSPGVSLYRSEVRAAREKGIALTSLLNLWFAEQLAITTICVTGTKGKSTTASLIAHILERLGRRVALAGNIGVPVTEIGNGSTDYAVIEVSSYQAADFDGTCDLAVLTSLYPEHIDWHLNVQNYFRDKLNLVGHSRSAFVNRDAAVAAEQFTSASPLRHCLFNDESGVHARGIEIFDGGKRVGQVSNPYLARTQNRSNLCAALAAAKSLDIDPAAALAASIGFRGLPHRQQELGEVDGVLYVDDSISTIPESTLAALAVYAGRDTAVIVGGYDRGVDYRGLVRAALHGGAKAVICLGTSGRRIYDEARAIARRQPDLACTIHQAESMEHAVRLARRAVRPGGVVLLSPAAPSYGEYRDYIERGRDFAAKAGLHATAEVRSYSLAE